jgi:formiminotetrahydrofolate cyclodeaminase
MSRISRRKMLIGSAVLGTTVAGTGIAREQEPSGDMSALIEAHEAAYAAFMSSIRKPDDDRNDHAARSQAEEKALLAVCGYPTVSEIDRRTKATYLLEIETRGELDLREHMRAVLLSMM